MKVDIHDLRAPAPLIRKLNARRTVRRDGMRPWLLISLGMVMLAVYELWQVIP
jgi:hypothetical protein